MKVLHINDVARIGTLLMEEAVRRGLPWDLLPIARQDPSWSPRTRAAKRAFRGLAWEAKLASKVFKYDLINLHGGNIRRHTAWVPKPYVLHLHGSDVRTVRLELDQRPIIDTAIAQALQVYYTTPDLRENVLPLRSDATLQPVVVDTDEIPAVTEICSPPRVVFPSRWDSSKGGARQIEVAVALRKKLGKDILFEGLDWGENARIAACDASITLLPRLSHKQYVQWIATGTVAVGQMSGMMAISEIESIATGLPLVTPLNPSWYDGSHPSTSNVPVLVGPIEEKDSVDAVVEAVAKQLASRELTQGREWVKKHHSPQKAVDRLLSQYSQLSL